MPDDSVAMATAATFGRFAALSGPLNPRRVAVGNAMGAGFQANESGRCGGGLALLRASPIIWAAFWPRNAEFTRPRRPA